MSPRAVRGRPCQDGPRKTSPTVRIPPAYASYLLPHGRRTWHWYLVRCPACGAPHLGRARELADVTRTRRLPCGHQVQVVIARTYGQPGTAS